MNYEELIKQLKSCVFTVIYPELAGSAATAIQLLTERLAAYEDTGLTPQEIEQMKARMPLHQWAGESPEKMSIFGVSVSRIIELTKAEKQGRLIILSIQDVHPCRGCDTGWGSISSEGCTSCEETCVRLKEYNEKYNT